LVTLRVPKCGSVLRDAIRLKADPDLAVLALMKSEIEKGIWLLDNNELVMALERGPVHEAYMVTWFYGLVHELGHLHPNQTRASSEDDKFSDGWMIDAITAAFDSLPYLSHSIKEKAIETAKQRPSDSVIGIDQLRNEGWADIFACSVLFQSTFDIMREINQKRFQVARFIAEVCIFLKIIALIERCRQVALIAPATVANRDAQSETLLHPASVLVRAIMQRSYLNSAVTTYLYGPALRQNSSDAWVTSSIMLTNTSRRRLLRSIVAWRAR
jgi:hypothetical protein